MTYEPLHHKYRPQTFADLVGQNAIATTLVNAIQQRRIAPAYLFTGPRGTGKTSSARILAKSLNCLSSDVPTEKPCGKCLVCTSIAKGSSLDVIEIDAASNTGVDNIREMIERAQFAPVQCRYKVYTIDEVHMLSTAAFNALLKTLEEPPEKVVFVLATTDPQRVLSTIISRCQRFDFRRIPLEDMVKHLRVIASKENIDIADDALILVGQVAQGGLRDAESLLDQLSLLSGQVTVERVWDLVGAVPERDLLAMLDAIAQNNASDVLEIARRLMDRGREPLIVLQNLAGFYRDLSIAKTASNRPDLASLTAPTWKALCEKSLAIDEILAGQKHLKDSEVQIKNTTQPRLWLEVTLLGLLPSAINRQEPPKPLPSSGINQREKTVSSSAQLPQSERVPKSAITEESKSSVLPDESRNPEPIKEAINPVFEEISAVENDSSISESGDVYPEEIDVEKVWQQVLNNIEIIGTRTHIRVHCSLVGFNNHEGRIGVHKKSMLKAMQAISPQFEKAFFNTFKRKVKVTFEALEKTEYKSNFSDREQPPKNSPEITEPNARNTETIAPSKPMTIAPTPPKVESQTQTQAKPSQPSEISEQSKPILPPISDVPKTKEQDAKELAIRAEAEISERLKPIVPPISDVPKTKEQDAKELAKRAESETIAKLTQRLLETFKGEIVELPEKPELTETVSRNLRSQPLKPDFDVNSEIEPDPEEDDDF